MRRFPAGFTSPIRTASLPQATKIAIPNIGSMFIGMIKDTSTFTVIGLLEVVRVTQNINAQTFQPFVLYTATCEDGNTAKCELTDNTKDLIGQQLTLNIAGTLAFADRFQVGVAPMHTVSESG